MCWLTRGSISNDRTLGKKRTYTPSDQALQIHSPRAVVGVDYCVPLVPQRECGVLGQQQTVTLAFQRFALRTDCDGLSSQCIRARRLCDQLSGARYEGRWKLGDLASGKMESL